MNIITRRAAVHNLTLTGASQKAIAAALNVSPRTVRSDQEANAKRIQEDIDETIAEWHSDFAHHMRELAAGARAVYDELTPKEKWDIFIKLAPIAIRLYGLDFKNAAVAEDQLRQGMRALAEEVSNAQETQAESPKSHENPSSEPNP